MGTPSATVYVDYVGTPHTFIKLDDGNGNVEYFGFAPKTPGSFAGPGTVGVGLTTHAQGDPDNSKAGYIDDVGYSKSISLSTEQYRAMKDRVGEWQGNTDAHYNAVGTNCTAFVKDVLEAGNAKYDGIGWGPNPMNLIPVNEQGPLFTTNSDGVREFSDRVRDPANTPGTPAYEYRQQHPDLFQGANAPTKSDLVNYDLHQDKDGNWVEESVSVGAVGVRTAKGKEGEPFTAFNIWLENKEIEAFFPIGMSFDDATVVLQTAGFRIRPRPLNTDPKFRFWFGANMEMPTRQLFFGNVGVEFEPDEQRLENVNIKSSSMNIAVHGNSL